MGEENNEELLTSMDSLPSWDYRALGFKDKNEFIMWCYFNRKNNPKYHGQEEHLFEEV